MRVACLSYLCDEYKHQGLPLRSCPEMWTGCHRPDLGGGLTLVRCHRPDLVEA